MAAPINANEQANTQLVETHKLNVSISVGAGGFENPLVNSENTFTPILPHINYYGDKWYFEDFSLGYSLIENEHLILDVATNFNEDGFFFELDGLDNFFITSIVPSGPTRPGGVPVVANEIQRKLSYLGGLSAIIPNSFATINIAYLKDISGVHHGSETHLSALKILPLLGGDLAIEAAMVAKDEKLSNYYYMLRPGEALIRIPEYELGTSYNAYVKLAYWLELDSHWAIDFQLKRTRLDSQLADTPLIQKQYYYSGFLGLNYRF
ncbi:MipA/OmpV family protein [Pseudoalteromonas sp. KAN5]|nr:MipA/OmpV family protein [Pseudoalteromonas sp. KAN5]BDF93334.1 outer membrane MltA-interaction protein MipA [Pseudoalteromonas sp. KAN5]